MCKNAEKGQGGDVGCQYRSGGGTESRGGGFLAQVKGPISNDEGDVTETPTGGEGPDCQYQPQPILTTLPKEQTKKRAITTPTEMGLQYSNGRKSPTTNKKRKMRRRRPMGEKYLKQRKVFDQQAAWREKTGGKNLIQLGVNLGGRGKLKVRMLGKTGAKGDEKTQVGKKGSFTRRGDRKKKE